MLGFGQTLLPSSGTLVDVKPTDPMIGISPAKHFCTQASSG